MAKGKGPRRKSKPVNSEERNRMLFWYTVFDGNYNKTAKRISEETGHKRSAKVVMDTARKFNFATLSHVVRDEVNKRFYGTDTPGMGRIMKMTADLLEIDEEILVHCKRFMKGDRTTKITDVKELLSATKQVLEELKNISGIKGIKDAAFHDLAAKTRPDITLTADQILGNLDEDERAEVLSEVVESQMTTILETRGDRSGKRLKKKDKDMDEIMSQLSEQN